MDNIINEENSYSVNDLSEQTLSLVDTAILQEMIGAGIIYGRKKTKTHPKMRDYIFATRNSVEIINVNETLKFLRGAETFLRQLFKDNPNARILMVGTQPSAREAIESLAKKYQFPYVVNRWVGGLLTNYKIISKRIDYFKKLKSDKTSGAWEKYTKKERLNFDREINRMDKLFVGVETMTKLPEVLLIINPKLHSTAINEAKRLAIPVIAIMNTDVSPDLATLPIVANDNSSPSIRWILAFLEKVIEESLIKK